MANDLVAAGVIGFLTDQGINVPDQVSVVGYDNNLIAPITIPTLTSVDQDPRTLGRNRWLLYQRYCLERKSPIRLSMSSLR